MKKIIFFFALLFNVQLIFGQSDINKLVDNMNNCIKAFSIDNNSPVTFYKVSGILEQKQGELSQRITLASINKILVENSKAGFSVSLACKESGGCISLLKADMTASTMGSTVFFFNNPAAANTFAQNTASITSQINEKELIETILYKNAEGQTPLLPAATAKEPIPIAKPAPKKIIDEDDDTEPAEPKEIKKTGKATTKKAKVDDDEDEPKEPKLTAKSKKASEKSIEANDDEDEPKATKPTAKSKKASKKEVEVNDDEDEPKATKPTAKSKKASEKEVEVNDEKATVPKNDFCAQLLSIVASGAEKQFKDIEGSETNAEKKINDSKIKLKGAKKNYLSWFKEKRAFIAELKILNDNEEAIIAFEELQNTLDECLANGWEDNDHSSDPIYEKATFEVKDVEYTKGGDMNKPTIRISIVPDGKRFILFVRVR